MEIPNQSSFQVSQKYEVNIDKMYEDFIKEIDEVRSIVNITGKDTQDILNKLTVNQLTSLVSLVKIENTPQESRCHAFYRLIGFPVVDSDFRMYSPGFYKFADLDKSKVEIANKPIAGFRELSILREKYANTAKSFFANNSSINAAVLALSIVNNREFKSPFAKNSNFDDMEPKNQNYKINLDANVGNQKIPLSEFMDENDKSPTILPVMGYHYIKPFLVDPRIDFTVSPAKNRVAVPFVPDKSYLIMNDKTIIRRPLLEKVIRDRLGVFNAASTLGISQSELIEYIKKQDAIKNEKIIEQITSDNYSLSDKAKFVEYLNIINAMMKKLNDAIKTVKEVQANYYYLPIPSKLGPEGGSEVRGIIISQNMPSTLKTEQDNAIIDAQIKFLTDQLNVETKTIVGQSDLGNFAFENFKTFDNSSESLENQNLKNLNFLNERRNHDISLANDALRTIEIITGELSGLGLCDIIAIMASLYIIPDENLIGLLDEAALQRARQVSELRGIPEPSNVKLALSVLSENVKNFYNLMDKIYQDLSQNNDIAQ